MSDNIIYTSIPAVLESVTTLEARIAMLDTILNGMETAILRASTTGEFDLYRIDTGQTKNEVTYRSIGELTSGYAALIKVQQMFYARLNNNKQGRIHRLVGNKNFI